MAMKNTFLDRIRMQCVSQFGDFLTSNFWITTYAAENDWHVPDLREKVLDFSMNGRKFEMSDVLPRGKWRKTYLPGGVTGLAIERTCEDPVKTSMD